MSEFKRLLESSDNPLTRNLLESGLPDAPRADTLQRTATALGFGTLTTAATSGVFASGTASEIAASSLAGAGNALGAVAASKAAAPSLALAVLKWLGVGLLGGGAVAGVVAGVAAMDDEAKVTARSPVNAPSVTSTHSTPQKVYDMPSPPSAAERVPATPPPEAAAEPSVAGPATAKSKTNISPGAVNTATHDDAPATTPPGVSASTGARGSPAPATPELEAANSVADSTSVRERENARALQREVAMIDAAKLALAMGNANQCLRLLDEYAQKRQIGVFDREALVLRIDALLRQSNVSEARRLAAQYLNAYPNDAHSPRLERLLSSAENPR